MNQTLVKHNTGLTSLGSVFEKVKAMSENNWDEMVKVKEIQFPNIDTMVIGKDSYAIRPVAQREIAFRLGVPINYIKKCPEYLQLLNLDFWLSQEKNEELFVRFDGDHVRALFTPKYQPIDNHEIIEKLYSLGYDDKFQVQSHLDDEFLVLNIPEKDKTFRINNDKMSPGISISNSEVGLASVAIAAYILRLVCTNGLIAPSEISSARFKHVSKRFMDEMPEVLAGARQELSNQQNHLRISMSSPVDHPLNTIESFNNRFQLNVQERAAVEWAWPMEEGKTMFNLVQTYTRAAQFDGLSAEASYRLQKVGGNILAMLN